MRRSRNINVELDLPNKFKYYSDVYSFYPKESQEEMKAAILKHKGEQYWIDNELTDGLTRSQLWRHAKFVVDTFKVVSSEFDTFVSDNPWVKEFYEFSVDKGVYIRLNKNNWTTVSKTKGGEEYTTLRNSFTYANFVDTFNEKYLLIFNELRRKVPFVAGNIVILRDKYLNSEGHDPFIRKTQLRNCERIGTVISLTDSIHNWSYGGKGSRLVNVLWSASGETTTASINSLKLFDRKDRVVDKLVER
jgi:hypothetical protein